MALCDTAAKLLETIECDEISSPSILEVHEMARMMQDRRHQAQLLLIAISMTVSLNGGLGRMAVVRNREQITVKFNSDTKGVRCPKHVLAKALADMGWEESHTEKVHTALFGSSEKHRSSDEESHKASNCKNRRSPQHRSRRTH